MMRKQGRDALRPVVSRSLNTVIRERTKEFILREKLRPGDKLPTEEVLSERLQVSRSVLREALRSLEALGVIEARQGSGRVVRDFNFDPILANLSYGFAFQDRTIQHLSDVRKALDLFFIESIVGKASAAQIDGLKVKLQEIKRKMREHVSYATEDYEFHRLLYDIADNPLATQLFEITWDARFHTHDLTFWLPAASMAREFNMHAGIVKALEARDAGMAREAVLAHYRHTDARIKQRVAAEGAAASNGAQARLLSNGADQPTASRLKAKARDAITKQSKQ